LKWLVITPDQVKAAGGRVPIPGMRWDQADKLWRVPASPLTCPMVEKVTGSPCRYGAEWPMPSNFDPVTPPYSHQRTALERSWGEANFALFMEQGTGKTKVIIDTAELLRDNHGLQQVLIVCPKTVIGTWESEIRTHGHPHWKVFKWPLPFMSPCFTEAHKGGIRALIINPDALLSNVNYLRMQEFLGRSTQNLMVIDESTIIKNARAKRTEKCWILGMRCKWKRILTGTPIAHSPLDLWSQLQFLDSKIMNSSFFQFRGRYALMGGWGNKEVIGFRNLEDLTGIIDPWSFRVTKEECLDLPPKVYEVREVELKPEAMKMYRSAKELMLKDVVKARGMDASRVKTTALGHFQKLRQITGGAVKIDDSRFLELDQSKIAAVFEILEEVQGQVIIWCQFKHEIRRLKEAIPSAGVIDGGATALDRDEAIKNFQIGKSRCIICQNDAGSLGITLTAASTAIFYSNSDRYSSRIQAEDRCHRAGQTKSVTYYDLIVPGTVDRTMMKLLKNKQNLADKVLEALKEVEDE